MNLLSLTNNLGILIILILLFVVFCGVMDGVITEILEYWRGRK